MSWIIALIDILGYILREELTAVLFFCLVAMITYYYTKNMTIVLGTSLIVTSIIHLFKNIMGIKEGLKDMKTKESVDDTLEESDETEEEEEKEEKEEEEEEEENNIIEPINKDDLDKITKQSDNLQTMFKDKTNNTKKSLKSGYQNQQKLTPGLYNMPSKKNLQKQLGEADKMEAAYDNLEKVIGSNGIQSMSDSTKELVRQQKELLSGLKSVTPALNEAMGAIAKIDIGGLKDIFNNTMAKTKE